jgi:hypothetical protein
MNSELEHIAGLRHASLIEQKHACHRQLAPIVDCLLDLGVMPDAIVSALAHLSMLAAAAGRSSARRARADKPTRVRISLICGTTKGG